MLRIFFIVLFCVVFVNCFVLPLGKSICRTVACVYTKFKYLMKHDDLAWAFFWVLVAAFLVSIFILLLHFSRIFPTVPANDKELHLKLVYEICKTDYPSMQDLGENECFYIDLDKVYDYTYTCASSDGTAICNRGDSVVSMIITYRDGSKNRVSFKIGADYKKCYVDFKKTLKSYKNQKGREVIK